MRKGLPISMPGEPCRVSGRVDGALNRPLTGLGSPGREIARRLRELDALLDPHRTHDFVIPARGLDAYPIIRPNNDAIFTPSRAPLLFQR